jgi:hypothetical protein
MVGFFMLNMLRRISDALHERLYTNMSFPHLPRAEIMSPPLQA